MAEPHGLSYHRRRDDGAHLWRVRPYIDGKRVTKVFDTPTDSIAKARRKALAVVAEMEEAAHRRAAPSVANLLDDWLERTGGNLSPRTLHGYRRRANIVAEHVGTIDADALKVDDVDRMYHRLRQGGTSDASVLEVHRVLNAALRWAYDMERIPAMPNLRRVKPRHRPAEVRPPTAEVVSVLLDGMHDAEWTRAVRLLVLCGLRRGEVVGLEWADVEPAAMVVRNSVLYVPGDGVVVKRATKSSAARLVELGAGAVDVLDRQRQHVTEVAERAGAPMSRWVFPSYGDDDTPRSPDWVSRAWNRYRAKFGADEVRLHDLRHFYATAALSAGLPVHAVAAQLGHQDATTTMRIYGHAVDADRARVAGAVERALEAPARNRPHDDDGAA